MVHNWGEKGTGKSLGSIKYAKKLLNYVFPQETNCCEILLMIKLALDLKKRILFLVWSYSYIRVKQASLRVCAN